MPALSAQPATPASNSEVNSTEVLKGPQESTIWVAMATPTKPNTP